CPVTFASTAVWSTTACGGSRGRRTRAPDRPPPCSRLRTGSASRGNGGSQIRPGEHLRKEARSRYQRTGNRENRSREWSRASRKNGIRRLDHATRHRGFGSSRHFIADLCLCRFPIAEASFALGSLSASLIEDLPVPRR